MTCTPKRISQRSCAASAADSPLVIEPRRSPRLLLAVAAWLAGLAALLLFETQAPLVLRAAFVAALGMLTLRPVRTHLLLQGPDAVRRLTLAGGITDNRWQADLGNGGRRMLQVRGASATLGPLAWLHLAALDGQRWHTIVVLDEATAGTAAFRDLRRWLRLGPARRFL